MLIKINIKAKSRLYMDDAHVSGGLGR